MRITRLTTLSLIYNLKEYLHEAGFTTESEFKGSFPYVKVMAKDQAYRELDPPCIVVYSSNLMDSDLQIGGGYWYKIVFNFDVYASTDATLLELSDLMMHFLERQTTILGYDIAAPSYQVSGGFVRTYYENASPSAICSVFFENRTATFLDRVNTIGEATAHSAQFTTTVSIPTN